MTVDEINRASGIVGAVLSDHKLHRDDFFSQCREPHLVAARIDAAKRLREARMSIKQISLTLKRSHETIGYYLYPKIKARKTANFTAKWPLKWLDPDARQVVCEYAAAEGATPRTIIAEWIRERAEYESKAKREAVAA